MDLKVVLVAVFVFLMCPVNGLWWALGSPVVLDPTRICKKTRKLRSRQMEMCQREPKVIHQVYRGAELGTKECQFQFQERRWNCSTNRRSIRKLLMRDTRETGFVNAVTAAGVTFSVTQACTTGHLQCTCVRSKESANVDVEWKWGGCGDNVEFGYKKSREFMDAKYRKKSDVKTLVMLHNNEAGRQAVKGYMRRACKCHGLSGSCTTKVCWRRMPLFRDVGNRLKDRFDGAAKVIPRNDGKSIMPEGSTIKPPGKEDLIYSEDSPDFCRHDRKSGSLGTQGRECNFTSPGVAGCELLCCGRRVLRDVVVEKRNCRCSFKWCCEVTCDTCNVTRTISRCA